MPIGVVLSRASALALVSGVTLLLTSSIPSKTGPCWATIARKSWSQRNGWAATIAASRCLDDREQVDQRDSGLDPLEVGQAVDQEMPLEGRDLDAGKHDQAIGSGVQLGQFAGFPLVINGR